MRRVRYVARLKSAAAGEAGKSKAVMSGKSSSLVSSKRVGEQQQARGLLESLAGKGEEEEPEKK